MIVSSEVFADERRWRAAAASNSAEIRVDPLQRLHTLQNLASLLGPSGDGVPSVPRTLRDANLQARRPAVLRTHVQPETAAAGVLAGERLLHQWRT